MKILVAINSPISDYSKIKKKTSHYDLVIAADGAARHLQALSITPDIIIGDFDSFKTIPKEWKKVELIKYSKEKDVSDGELAINLASKKKPKELDIIGLTGGALDHTIANLELLKKIPIDIDVNILNEDETIYRVTLEKEINTISGNFISIIDFQGTPLITLKGLKYKLPNNQFKSPTHGLSNVAEGKKIKISLSTKGIILCLVYSRK